MKLDIILLALASAALLLAVLVVHKQSSHIDELYELNSSQSCTIDSLTQANIALQKQYSELVKDDIGIVGEYMAIDTPASYVNGGKWFTNFMVNTKYIQVFDDRKPLKMGIKWYYAPDGQWYKK